MYPSIKQVQGKKKNPEERRNKCERAVLGLAHAYKASGGTWSVSGMISSKEIMALTLSKKRILITTETSQLF